MKIQITIQNVPDGALRSAPLKKFRARLNEAFSAWQPRQLSEDPATYDFLKHELTMPADDPAFEKRLAEFHAEIKKDKLGFAATVQAYLTKDEVPRARWLQLYIYGDWVDEDSKNRLLNPLPHSLCAACKFPDISKMPNPLLVSGKALKKQDVFGVTTGLLVVRPQVLELLQQAIPDQIDFGVATIVPDKKGAANDDKLFWVRPKELVGNQLGKSFPKTCRVCQRPLESRKLHWDDRIKKGGPGLYDERPRLEHFGSGQADLALIDGYYGEIHPDGRPQWHWTLAISGALFTFLKKNGVTGIAAAAGSDPAECFGSAKEDAILEPVDRTFTVSGKTATVKADPVAKTKAEQKVLASLKHVPWDCDDTGHVYFYLTTPEIIVLDPMTWEEDAGGPYTVKNFSKPGLYRLKVSAIKNATNTNRGVAVDSATLLIVDNAYFAKLQERYEWEKAIKSDGEINREYYDKIAAEIGSRFAVCTTPASKFKSAFQGDGSYQIDTKGISRAAE